MTFVVDVGGRTVRVELVRAQNGWDAEIDGRAMHVDAAQAGTWISLLVGPGDGPDVGAVEAANEGQTEHAVPGAPNVPTSEGRRRCATTSHEVAIEDRGRGELVVHVDGTAIPLTVGDPRGPWARRGHDHAKAGAGPRTVVAPMPGRVVKILVKRGETVTARQGLVVVEAMKMENELRSPKDGTVAEIAVTEGASVEAGTVLVVVD